MNNNNGPMTLTVLDEIGLEGLDGLTLEGLWKRLSVRHKLELPLNQNFCTNIWNFVRRQSCVSFYELPEEREPLKLFDRTKVLEELPNNDACLFTVYPYQPIEDNDTLNRGSCATYYTRREIARIEIENETIATIELKYGMKFVIVGSQKLRESVLLPEYIHQPIELLIVQYCLLERVARARYNGELTVGKNSLADIAKDASNLFYHRRHLMKLKLIARQPYSEKGGDVMIMSSLIHLPRFYIELKSKQMIIIEEIIRYLKDLPLYMSDYESVRARFDTYFHKYIKKILRNPLLVKHVETDLRVTYRTLHPDATEIQWRKKGSQQERTVICMRLRDPNIDLSNLFPNEIDPEDDEKDIAFLNDSNILVDMPLLNQAYYAADAQKHAGITTSELGVYLGLDRLQTRAIVKNLIRLNLVTSFAQNIGRQKVIRYVIPKYSAELQIDAQKVYENYINKTTLDTDEDKSTVSIISTNEIVKSTKVTNIVRMHGYSESNMSKVVVKIEQMKKTKFDSNTSTTAQLTERMMSRLNMIVETLKTKKIIDDVVKLAKHIQLVEKELGMKETMCRKSLLRLLSRLSKDKCLKMWNICFTWEKKNREILFITEPSIDINDDMFKGRLHEAKVKFLMSVTSDSKQLKKGSTEQIPPILRKQVEKDPQEPGRKKLRHPTSSMVCYGYSPKCVKMRLLHKYLIELVHDDNREDKYEISRDRAIEYWKTIEPTTDYDTIQDELPAIYSMQINSKMFIRPQEISESFPRRWCTIQNIIENLPLSLFTKLCTIYETIPILDELLSHPIRKHYPLHYLPITVQKHLRHCKPFTFIEEIIKLLACLGLVQIGPNNHFEMMVYVNLNATLKRTTSSEPGYIYTSNDNYPEQNYKFNSFEEVQKYWTDLYQISMVTKLGRRSRIPETIEDVRWYKKAELQGVLKPRTIEEIELSDNGQIPGDGRGAAGLDSILYIHLPRNWMRYKNKLEDNDNQNANDNQNTNNVNTGGRKPVPVRMITSKVVKNKLTPPTAQKRDKKVVIRVTKVRRVGKLRKPKYAPKSRLRIPYLDSVDKEALLRMTKLRVDWNSEEDNLLLLCKIGSLYFFPNRKPIGSAVIRDILQWKCGSMNKTSRACQRRILYLMRTRSVASSVHMCVQEVRQNSLFTERFGTKFVQHLCKIYPNEHDLLMALKIQYINLVAMLFKYYYRIISCTLETEHFTLPTNFDEYIEKVDEKDEEYLHEKTLYLSPINNDNIILTTIITLIHSSMCCGRDKTSWTLQMYDIYKNYSDSLLARAMAKVRQDQFISVNKTTKTISTEVRNLPLTAISFHLSLSYINAMASRIPYEIFDDIFVKLTDIYEINVTSSQAQWPNWQELVHETFGLCFVLAEHLYNERIVTIIDVPNKVLVLESEKDDVEHTRINFDQPQEAIGDYEGNVTETITDVDCSGQQQFPIEDHFKKYTAYYHLFCLVENFGISISDRSALYLLDEKFCTFDCILKRENQFDEFYKIITAHLHVCRKVYLMEYTERRMKFPFKLNISNVLNVLSILVRQTTRTDFDVTTFMSIVQKLLSNCGLTLNDNFDNNEWFEDVDIDENEFNEFSSFDGGLPSDKVHKYNDLLFLSNCKMNVKLAETQTVQKFSLKSVGGCDNYNGHRLDMGSLLDKIIKQSRFLLTHGTTDDFMYAMRTIPFTDLEYEMGIIILEHIRDQGVNGASGPSLLELLPSKNSLQKIIDVLMDLKIVLRTGVDMVLFVHYEHAQSWLVKSFNIKRLEREKLKPITKAGYILSTSEEGQDVLDEPPAKKAKQHMYSLNMEVVEDNRIFLIPKPWVRVNGSVNRRTLDKWIGTILLYCISEPGVTISKLSLKFIYLTPMQIRYLLEYLRDLYCIKLYAIEEKTHVTLLSKYQLPTREIATDFDLFQNIYVEVMPDALTILTLCIGYKKYSSDFV